MRRGIVGATLLMILCPLVAADDWPMLGRDKTRNAVSPEKNPPVEWDLKTGKNIKWKAKLGTMTFAAPAVADGLVWVAANNGEPRDKSFTKDAGVLMCFRERDGQFLYQYLSPHLGNRYLDWPGTSSGCTPLVEGDRLWYTTNRCEMVCFDIGPLRRGTGEPKVHWKVDMIKDLGVVPYGNPMGVVTRCSPAIYKDFIYEITGNGVDASHENIPAPNAPSLVCFHKETGKVVWQDNSPGKNILHGQWASPLVLEINGRAQVLAPLGDGWLRSFDAETGQLIWKFDTNRKSAVYNMYGRGTRNYPLAPPVYYDGRVYIANGRHPEHADGPATLWCLDPAKEGDISAELEDGPRKGKPNPNSAVVWSFEGEKGRPEETMARACAAMAIADGLVIMPTLAGYIHCLDANTGKRYWTHDTLYNLYGSPLIVDGKVYFGLDGGDVLIFALSREKKLLATHDMRVFMNAPPIYANGVLYVIGRSTLYAIQEEKAKK